MKLQTLFVADDVINKFKRKITGNNIGNLWQRINTHIMEKAFFTYKQPNTTMGKRCKKGI